MGFRWSSKAPTQQVGTISWMSNRFRMEFLSQDTSLSTVPLRRASPTLVSKSSGLPARQFGLRSPHPGGREAGAETGTSHGGEDQDVWEAV